MIQTQLLCTFIPANELDKYTKSITEYYTLAFNNIYVLENIEDATQLILTYNIIIGSIKDQYAPPHSTISVHRKKQTNTIYTINALNALIASKNNGVMDKSYQVDWRELQNSVLVTAHGQLKIVRTKIQNIINI